MLKVTTHTSVFATSRCRVHETRLPVVRVSYCRVTKRLQTQCFVTVFLVAHRPLGWPGILLGLCKHLWGQLGELLAGGWGLAGLRWPHSHAWKLVAVSRGKRMSSGFPCIPTARAEAHRAPETEDWQVITSTASYRPRRLTSRAQVRVWEDGRTLAGGSRAAGTPAGKWVLITHTEDEEQGGGGVFYLPHGLEIETGRVQVFSL